jgi:hypothetical protein
MTYLKHLREFKTALPIHLFQALQDVAEARGVIAHYGNLNMIEYYKSWSDQAGHPVLYVDVNHRTGQMLVYQVIFFV